MTSVNKSKQSYSFMLTKHEKQLLFLDDDHLSKKYIKDLPTSLSIHFRQQTTLCKRLLQNPKSKNVPYVPNQHQLQHLKTKGNLEIHLSEMMVFQKRYLPQKLTRDQMMSLISLDRQQLNNYASFLSEQLLKPRNCFQLR